MVTRQRVQDHEALRKEYRREVRKLMMEAFGMSEAELVRDDALWGRYLEAFESHWHELRDLLTQEGTRAPFRARALTILTAPDYPPFVWKESSHSGFTYLGFWALAPDRPSLATLPAELQRFAARLTALHLSLMDWSGDQTSGYFREKHWGYHTLALELLSSLPDTSMEANELFDRYRLFDQGFVPHEGRFSSCASPSVHQGTFARLLQAPIPESWKRLATEQWERNLRSWRSTRDEDWLGLGFSSYDRRHGIAAAEAYVVQIEQSWRRKSEDPPYSAELLARQLEFLLDVLQDYGHPFDAQRLGVLLEPLQGIGYRALRERLVRYVFLFPDKNGQAFQIRHPLGLEDKTARLLLEEYDDLKLRERMCELLTQYHEYRKWKLGREQERAVVLALMSA